MTEHPETHHVDTEEVVVNLGPVSSTSIMLYSLASHEQAKQNAATLDQLRTTLGIGSDVDVVAYVTAREKIARTAVAYVEADDKVSECIMRQLRDNTGEDSLQAEQERNAAYDAFYKAVDTFNEAYP